MSVEILDDAVVRRYVKALYEFSSGRESVFLQQIKAVREAIESMDGYEKVLKRFSLLIKDGEAFVDALISELGLLSEVGNFLKLVLSNKRFAIVLDICKAYENFCDQMGDKKIFYITYAGDFSEKSKIELRQSLQAMTGGTVEFVVRQDPSLIGGLQVRCGSKILDYSMKSKLERLRKSMRGETRI